MHVNAENGVGIGMRLWEHTADEITRMSDGALGLLVLEVFGPSGGISIPSSRRPSIITRLSGTDLVFLSESPTRGHRATMMRHMRIPRGETSWTP